MIEKVICEFGKMIIVGLEWYGIDRFYFDCDFYFEVVWDLLVLVYYL